MDRRSVLKGLGFTTGLALTANACRDLEVMIRGTQCTPL